MSYSVTLDMSEFHDARDQTFREIRDAIEQALDHAAHAAVDEARAVGRYQDRTGNLRNGAQIFARIGQWKVVWPQPYAYFVEKGTRPHRIEGNPLLRFYWPKVGAWVAFRGVNHPGGRPFPFAGPALLKAERVLYREFELMNQRVQKIWKRAA